jgi:FMN phosphatase YigB (HAD superfamily)
VSAVFGSALRANQPEDFLQAVSDTGLHVDFVASSTQWRVEKPSPAFFNKIVDELNLAPSSIAYVRDRLDNDVLPALAAGLIAVFIRRGPWGFLHSQRPEAIKAHLRIDSVRELPTALERFAG